MKQFSRPRRLLGIGASGILAVSIILGTAPLADAATGRVITTGGSVLNVRSAPSVSSTVIGTLAPNSTISFSCYVRGDTVSGPYGSEDIWDRLDSGGYVADAWIYTGSNGAVVGLCPTQTQTQPTPPPMVPSEYRASHITLRSDAGSRERNLLGLASVINSAANGANIDGQTLARVIYHEGGNYLTARRYATQLVEINLTSSVGIGQMQVGTAKYVALIVYRDWATLNNSDIAVRASLVYDIPYAVKYAAGYIRAMRNIGIQGDMNLFLSYCLSIDSARAWRDRGYSMNDNVLRSININPTTLHQRVAFYYATTRAIG